MITLERKTRNHVPMRARVQRVGALSSESMVALVSALVMLGTLLASPLTGQDSRRRQRERARASANVLSFFSGVGQRVRLGVTLDDNQPRRLDRQGAELTGVLDDSPAEEAGLHDGDVITRVNGHDLQDPLTQDLEDDFNPRSSLPVQRLRAIARELEEGETVTIHYLRDDEAFETTLEVAELSQSDGIFRFDGSDFSGNVLRFNAPNISGGLYRGFSDRNDEEQERWQERRNELMLRLRDLDVRMQDRNQIRERIRNELERRRWEELSDRLSTELDREDWEELEERIDDLRMSSCELRNRIRGLSGQRVAPMPPIAMRPGVSVVPRIFLDRSRTSVLSLDLSMCKGAQMMGPSCMDGISMTDLDEGLAGYFGVEEGVLVTDVHEDSDLGLEAGDVILSIDGRDVESVMDVHRLLGSYKRGDDLELTVRRHDEEITLSGQR